VAIGKISTDTTHRAVPRRELSFLFISGAYPEQNYTSDLQTFVRVIPMAVISVLLWRRCDTLCTSGIGLDDVIIVIIINNHFQSYQLTENYHRGALSDVKQEAQL